MSDNRDLLIGRLAFFLRRAVTPQGHLAQIVVQEGRGNCLPPHKGCSAECREARELLDIIEPYLDQSKRAPARQTRRARAAAGRRLPSVAARRVG